jgi:hypothetical protein
LRLFRGEFAQGLLGLRGGLGLPFDDSSQRLLGELTGFVVLNLLLVVCLIEDIELFLEISHQVK